MAHSPSRRHDRFLAQYGITTKDEIMTLLTKKKLELLAMAGRVKRYTSNQRATEMNNLFRYSERQFYRKLRAEPAGETVQVAEELPSDDDLEEFWSGIMATPKDFDGESCQWYQRQRREYEAAVDRQEPAVITPSILNECLTRLPMWRAAGQDRLQGYWWKRLSGLHPCLRVAYQRTLEGEWPLDAWMTTGRTILLPKTRPPSSHPGDYRPITCLPIQYKLLTAAISRIMWSHINEYDIIPTTQRGCTPGSLGCREQLLINKMIMEHAKRHQRNLSVAYIDFRKAFDSVSHDWIRAMLEMYGFDKNTVSFITASMKQWRTQMFLYGSEKVVQTRPIFIKRGIFQGDTLSPLLFCLSLVAVSRELERKDDGYRMQVAGVQHTLSHLLFMDDIKLYARTPAKLSSMVNVVKFTSEAIGMEFGLGKCAAMHIHHGVMQTAEDQEAVTTLDNVSIRTMEDAEFYRYLGIIESSQIPHDKIKDKLKKEFKQRTLAILACELNARNLTKAVNTFAVPVIIYSLGVVNWRPVELEQIDALLRKLLTVKGFHHPKASKRRLHMPRAMGGRGFISIVDMAGRVAVGTLQYIEKNLAQPALRLLKAWHSSFNSNYSIYHVAEQFASDCGVGMDASKAEIKAAVMERKATELREMPLHGQYWNRMDAVDADIQQSFMWINNGALRPATEGLILAAQDQCLPTRNYYHSVVGSIPQAEAMCRLCSRHQETVDHVIGSCSVLAATEYTKRHNRVVRYVHWSMCIAFGFPDIAQCYQKHELKHVYEHRHQRIMWELGIPTDLDISNDRPDIVFVDDSDHVAYLIDISVPLDQNVRTKYQSKVMKYETLRREVERLWKVKAMVVPVIIGALGTATATLQRSLTTIKGGDARMVQAEALKGSAKIIRNTLNIHS